MAVGRLFSWYLCPLAETPVGDLFAVEGLGGLHGEFVHLARVPTPIYFTDECKHPDVHPPNVMILIVRSIIGARESCAQLNCDFRVKAFQQVRALVGKLFNMRFRFLGDGDCPDWLLAEINTLSRMTSIKMKMLGQIVAKCLTEGELDEEKIKKITQDAKLDVGDAKAIIATLELIFTSSARYGVSAADLSSELQQLGLPREHSTAVARLHTDHCSQITAILSSQSLRVSRLSSIEVLPCDNTSPVSALALKLKSLEGKEEDSIINISKDDVQVLLKELKRARALMENL